MTRITSLAEVGEHNIRLSQYSLILIGIWEPGTIQLQQLTLTPQVRWIFKKLSKHPQLLTKGDINPKIPRFS